MKFSTRSTRRASAAGVIFLLSAQLVPGAFSQETTLRSQANVVLVPTLVKDVEGEIVYGLSAKDFIVQDDGIEQSVRLDETPEDQAISLVIAIQRGRRASYEFPRIRRLHSMLDPLVSQGHAKVAVIEFDSAVHPIHDFTSNSDLVAQDLNDLQPGDDGAVILDAINYAIKLLEQAPKERQRMLLLISETRDHGSQAKIDDVVEAIGRSNTVMYALAFSPALSNILDTGRGNNKAEMHMGRNGLDFIDLANRLRQAMRKNVPVTVAAMTGGEYELFATKKKFEVRMNDFTNHLHSRYLLSIAPSEPHPGLHQISVRLRDSQGTTVLARSSYWAHGTK